jgi:hypothetical protein
MTSYKVYLQRLGETIIVHSLSNARIVVSKTPVYLHTKYLREQEGCLNFICGEELDYTIKYFRLDLNAEKLRQLFWEQIE